MTMGMGSGTSEDFNINITRSKNIAVSGLRGRLVSSRSRQSGREAALDVLALRPGTNERSLCLPLSKSMAPIKLPFLAPESL